MGETVEPRPSTKLSLLHIWLDENHITLHPGISIIEHPKSGIAVTATTPLDRPILHPDRLAIIPKYSILSTRSCTLAPRIPFHPYGHGATLALSLALYSEQLLGTESRWHGYLQSLPATTVPIARLWSHPSAFCDADAVDAARWLHGTEVQRELQDEDGTPLTEEIDNFYHAEVRPLLESVTLRPSLAGFLHAYSLVCSRAFLVDAYHGLSMVPVADAFNHAHHNHVQLASEYDVCPACGSLSECPHDRQSGSLDGEEDPRSPIPPSIDSTDTVDMVTVCSVPPGVEVFNTYGAALGNAALLARYGFVLDGGETDTVTFGWPGSSLELEMGHERPPRWEKAYAAVRGPMEAAISGSSLVCVPETDAGRSSALSINSDGQVSVALFLWAVVDALPQEAADVQADMVLRVCSALVWFEALREADYEDEDAQAQGHGRFHDPEAVRVLTAAAGRIKGLCLTRAANMGAEGHRGASLEAIIDVLDDLPEDREKTHLAVEYLLSERAILGACAAGWEEMERTIDPGTGSNTSDEDMGDATA